MEITFHKQLRKYNSQLRFQQTSSENSKPLWPPNGLVSRCVEPETTAPSFLSLRGGVHHLTTRGILLSLSPSCDSRGLTSALDRPGLEKAQGGQFISAGLHGYPASSLGCSPQSSAQRALPCSPRSRPPRLRLLRPLRARAARQPAPFVSAGQCPRRLPQPGLAQNSPPPGASGLRRAQELGAPRGSPGRRGLLGWSRAQETRGGGHPGRKE